MIFNYFLLNSFLSYILMWVTYPFFNKYILDKPNSRSSHKIITPKGGGIIFVIITVFTSLFFEFYAPLICLPLALLGLADDKLEIRAIIRFLFQVFTSLSLILYASPSLDITNNSILLLILINLFLIILGTSIINFSNFFDGIDGILIGNKLVIFLLISFLFDQRYFLISGALIGFLKWNWSPAKIFMGDVGSTFLGALLFFAVVSSPSINQAFIILLISAPVLLDPFLCVIRRFVNFESIFSPHKKHLYQRLNLAGFSHSKVSLIYIISTLILSLSYIFCGFLCLLIIFIFLLLIGFWLDQKIAIPFK